MDEEDDSYEFIEVGLISVHSGKGHFVLNC